MSSLPTRRWQDMTTVDFATADTSRLDCGAAGRGDRAARAASAGLHRHLHRRGDDRADDRTAPRRSAGDLPAGAGDRQIERAYLLAGHAHLDLGDDDAGSGSTSATACYRAGVEKLIIVNSHGGNVPMVDIVARELRVRHDMLVVGTAWSRFGHPDGPADRRTKASTASMAARSRPRSCSTSVPTWCGWTRRSISARPSSTSSTSSPISAPTARRSSAGRRRTSTRPGTVGNASLATAEKGKAVVDHQAAGVRRALPRRPRLRHGAGCGGRDAGAGSTRFAPTSPGSRLPTMRRR